MFNFKKQKFPTGLFIIVSITVLIILPILMASLKSIINSDEDSQVKNNYALNNEKYDISDPFITKVINTDILLDGPIVDGKDPSLGDENAPIKIVYFADFECGFCQKQEIILKEILNEYKNKIKLIWKDYPINNLESPSYKAALAARCAGEQNNFWPFHDLLFEESHNLNKQTFIEIAQELNLKIKEFEKCIESEETKNLINNNIEEANSLDINGIPFTYVNKQEIMGKITLDELRDIIEIELNK